MASILKKTQKIKQIFLVFFVTNFWANFILPQDSHYHARMGQLSPPPGRCWMPGAGAALLPPQCPVPGSQGAAIPCCPLMSPSLDLNLLLLPKPAERILTLSMHLHPDLCLCLAPLLLLRCCLVIHLTLQSPATDGSTSKTELNAWHLNFKC